MVAELAGLLHRLVRAVVDQPDAVRVTEILTDSAVLLEVRVADGTVGQLIGKHGRNIQAIREILVCAAAKEGFRVKIDVIEPG
jgi:predicted RNA-binding protein YlqC (UPF0109 family)